MGANITTVITSELQLRIQSLAALSTVDLANEMQSLKRALLENPSACALLMDEDVGLLVAALRKKEGIALAAATEKATKKTPKTKEPKMSSQQIAEALEDM